MKLRIKGDSIRLRLTKTEVEEFGTKGNVKESVHFGPHSDQHFHYELLTRAGIEHLSVHYQNHVIQVMVPPSMAEAWVQTDQVGFEQTLNQGGNSIHLLVEKDFQCLHRDDAEEPDNYAHPLAK
jgi:hypothetical protein